MQSTGERSDIRLLANRVQALEDIAKKISNNLNQYLESSRGRLYIVYSRLGYLPANILYWIISTMTPENDVRLLDAMSYSYYVAAYTEPSTIVFFTTDPGSNITLNILQAARLMGNKILMISTRPQNDILADMLAPYDKIYVDLQDEIETSIAMGIAAFNTGIKIYKGLGRRHERLDTHMKEGFHPVTAELIEKYSNVIDSVASIEDIIVTSPKILEPSAYLISEALRRRGIKSRYEPLEYVAGPSDVLIISSTVEEHYMKEKIFKLRLMRAKIHQIVFNTDPLETNIYASIIGLYIARKR